MWENKTSQLFIQQKIEEFKNIAEARRKKKKGEGMPPVPYSIPSGGTATYHWDDNEPGFAIPDYSIVLSRGARPHIQILKIQTVEGGNARDIDEIANWSINTRNFVVKQKLCYWHADADNTTLFITHRHFGQIRIVYTQEIWDHYQGNFKMNFSVFNIGTPDRSDSSESDDDPTVIIPGPSDLPFHKF